MDTERNMFHYALSEMTLQVTMSKRLFDWLYFTLALLDYVALFILQQQRM